MEYMSERYKQIIERIQKIENREKYTELVLRPENVVDGFEIQELFMKLKDILHEFEQSNFNLGLESEFQRKINKIEKWLDDNNWGK